MTKQRKLIDDAIALDKKKSENATAEAEAKAKAKAEKEKQEQEEKEKKEQQAKELKEKKAKQLEMQKMVSSSPPLFTCSDKATRTLTLPLTHVGTIIRCVAPRTGRIQEIL